MHQFVNSRGPSVGKHRHGRSKQRPATEHLETRALLTAVVVNTTVDALFPPGSGIVSLRNALAIANSSTTPTTITFDPTVFATPQTILQNGTGFDMNPQQLVTITGPTSARVTVDGHAIGTVFSLSNDTVSISNLTITNGLAGGIVNQLGSTLTLTNVTLSNNVGDAGLDNLGTAILSNCTITGNTSPQGGGGIRNGSHLTITNSTIANNSATDGGGIFNSGTLTATNVMLSNNKAPGSTSRGGGLFEFGGNATLGNITATGNSSGDGAGIDNARGNLTLLNSTITGNGAAVDGGGVANGDQRDFGSGVVTITNCTIFGNSGTTGGGLYGASNCTTYITNSIDAGNAVGSAGAGPDAFGSFSSLGYNIVGETDGSSGSWNANDLTGTIAHPLNPMLAPLANYGGPTQTMPPLVGSPAIDAGFNAFALDANYNPLATDQRGYSRIYNSTVDIGAVEFQPIAIALTPGNNQLTLEQSADHSSIDWTLGAMSGQFLIADPESTIVNGSGGSDVITLNYTNGNPLPNVLHLNGKFTVNGLTGSNPLANTKLEIGKSTVYISYANPASDPMTTILSYLQKGYNGGLWNGMPTASTGVITSAAAASNLNQTTAIGYADFADGSGINSVPNSIELKYTLYGDTTLTGTVGFADFSRLTQTYGNTNGGTWDTGDWNYDGSVNFADFSVLTRTYGTALGGQTPLPAAAANTGSDRVNVTPFLSKSKHVKPHLLRPGNATHRAQ